MRYRREGPVVDYFGNRIEVGDRFFTGNPPQFGTVIAVKNTSIVIEYPKREWDFEEDREVFVSWTQNVLSPDQGVCLDKNTNPKYQL